MMLEDRMDSVVQFSGLILNDEINMLNVKWLVFIAESKIL
jgi:hypothetical protein